MIVQLKNTDEKHTIPMWLIHKTNVVNSQIPFKTDVVA